MPGEDWETESSSGEESSEAESDADDAADSHADGQGEPSVIADTICSLDNVPMTQVTPLSLYHIGSQCVLH